MSKISPGVLCASSYRTEMGKFASMRFLNVSYSRIDVNQVTRYYDALQPKKAVQRRYVIVRFPIERNPEMLNELRGAVARYQEPLPADRREVLRRYYFGDFARKVVGVGSVGTEAFVLLLMGDRDDEPLFLQVKEAQESVLAPFAGPSEYEHQGERVARGQRMIQAATDEFLGWTRGGGTTGADKAIAQFSVAYAEQNEKDYPRPRLTGPLLPAEGAQRRVKDLGSADEHQY